MKYIYIIALLGLAVAAPKAQEQFKPALAMGVSAGTTFSSVSFIPKVTNSMSMGITGGLTVRFDSERNVGLQAEINYIQHGWDETFIDPKYQYTRTLNYVELPILTHIYFGNKRVKVFLNLGPKIGYLIGEKTTQSNNFDNVDTEIETNPNPLEQHNMPIQNKLDWGLCGGPGFELRTGIGYFLLEGRYYYGLGDLYKSKKEDFFAKSAPQVISVKLTYLIPLGKKK